MISHLRELGDWPTGTPPTSMDAPLEEKFPASRRKIARSSKAPVGFAIVRVIHVS
jgi:hypothetical protein